MCSLYKLFCDEHIRLSNFPFVSYIITTIFQATGRGVIVVNHHISFAAYANGLIHERSTMEDASTLPLRNPSKKSVIHFAMVEAVSKILHCIHLKTFHVA